MTGTKQQTMVDSTDGDSLEFDFSMAGVEEITVLVDDNNKGEPSDYRLVYGVTTNEDESMKAKRVLTSSEFSHDLKPIGDGGEVRIVNKSGGTASYRVRIIYE